MIVRAAKHVAMAKEQRVLFVRKKAQAREDAIKGIPQEQRTYTFVADFAQNMYLPNFASEQPGATYYFSPLNVYPFGVVDPSGEQSQLIVHIYIEGEANKGGNAVASMIWKTLNFKGLINGQTAKEINIVFDNCAGQNKNRMVSRLLFFMVKLKLCLTARAIFLVKGHTKNDCDRMFNLMKYDYRSVNVYTPPELLELINRHPQVKAIWMRSNDFRD